MLKAPGQAHIHHVLFIAVERAGGIIVQILPAQVRGQVFGPVPGHEQAGLPGPVQAVFLAEHLFQPGGRFVVEQLAVGPEGRQLQVFGQAQVEPRQGLPAVIAV